MKDELKNQTKKNSEVSEQTALPLRENRKKKYTKPGVVYQASLEAMAATCTGACTGGPGAQGSCVVNCICNGAVGTCV